MGGEVVLREPRLDDAPELARAFAEEPDLGRVVGFEQDPDLGWWRDALADEAAYRLRGEGVNLVVTAGSDAPLGTAGLLRLDARHRRAEVTIWLVRGARGRGLGLATLGLLRDWAIPALGLQRLQLVTSADNDAMRRCAERAGFAFEEILRAYTYERGRVVDDAMLAVVA